MPDAVAKSRIPLLERDDLTPAQRARIGLATSSLLGVILAATGALGILAIWHLVRRGRLIRERLNPPKVPAVLDIESGPTQTPAPKSE